MHKRRYRILAGTALALILAAPLVSMAKNAVTPLTLPTDQLLLEIAHASVSPATADTAAVEPADEVQGNAAAAILNEPRPGCDRYRTTDPPAPDPLASLDPADRAVAQNIRDLLSAKADKLFANSKERAAVEAFYGERNFAPLWIEKGVASDRAGSVIARLKDAESDGLDPNEYRTPNFAGLGPDALAEADLRLTRAVLTFTRHLQAGRFHYTRVSRNIELPQATPEAAEVLNGVTNAADVGKALDLYSPQNEPYRKLKAKLAELRGKQTATKGEVGQADRDHRREHGALALVSARPRQEPCAREPPGLHAQGDEQRQPGVDDARRDRQAQHGDPAAERDDEVHHGQSDLDGAAVDRAERIPSGARARPDGARAHGLARQLQRRRRDDHPAAGRRQCAGARPVQHQQPLFRVPARHARQAHVRTRCTRLQPWLHAGAGSGQVRRSPPQDRAAERALERGADPAHVRHLRAEPATFCRP